MTQHLEQERPSDSLLLAHIAEPPCPGLRLLDTNTSRDGIQSSFETMQPWKSCGEMVLHFRVPTTGMLLSLRILLGKSRFACLGRKPRGLARHRSRKEMNNGSDSKCASCIPQCGTCMAGGPPRGFPEARSSVSLYRVDSNYRLTLTPVRATFYLIVNAHRQGSLSWGTV